MTGRVPVAVVNRLAGAAMAACVAVLSLACGSAERGGAAAPPDDTTRFVGVFTTSTVSYDDALASSDAVRFSADGTFVRGTWEAAEATFVAAPHDGPSPGFVARWEVATATRTFTFHLDGADESVPYIMDGPDRWRTVYDGPDGHVEVHYLRRSPR